MRHPATRQTARPALPAAPTARPVRPRLRIGPVDDPLEREADRIADAVVAGRPVAPSSGAPFGTLRRACAGCEEEEARIRRKETMAPASRSAGPLAADLAAEAVRGGGAPLSPRERAYFEPRFGRDLSAVRLHTDASAASAAAAIDARAYALGSHVAFAPGAYAPGTRAGDRLMAHELAHVVQDTDAVRRQPAGAASGKEEKPPDGIEFTAKDLLIYPLFIDLWNDIFAQKLTDKQKEEFRLKGKESAAIWNLMTAFPQAALALPDDATFGDFLEAWLEHAEEIHRIAGGDSFYLELFSSFVGLNLDSYLGSDLFKSRLKSHAASLVSILAVVQGSLSVAQALREPSAEIGEFEPTQWEKQTPVIIAVLNLALAEQFKAPDFFDLGPLKLETHPAYAAASAIAGGGPKEITFQHRTGQGEGQGGEQAKAGVTLNLAQIVALLRKDSPPAKEIADLQKYRGLQGSLWFSYDKLDPTTLQRAAGRLPYEAFHVGTLFGGGGFLGALEGGGRYGGEAAQGLTGWFLRGGFGYSGTKGEAIQKMGFTATYTDWTEQDILAPRIGEGGAPVGGQAMQFTPFTRLEFGERHKVAVGAALGFVTGTHENFGFTDMRGDFSYTYLGDRSPDRLPVFKIDISASVHRLDWWDPSSPLMTGLQARASIDRFFVAGQINTGAGDIPDQRAAQIGEAVDTVKVKVPTAVTLAAGVYAF